jgi:hypothetical protein
MFVNQYKINTATLGSGTTATTINIPITMEYQMVDQSELIERVFVETETEKAINPITDYEKTRFLPTDLNDNHIDKITYVVNLNGGLTYYDIGFTDNDIKFETEAFKQTFLTLSFYDTDNPMTQNLISFITLFSKISSMDLYQTNVGGFAGNPKPANQIYLTFSVENPILNPRGSGEGYHIYDYKDELELNGLPKYLYMKGTFNNAKTGKSTNLMVNSTALPIDQLITKLHTRYVLVRKSNGYYYQIDNTYSNNVSYNTNNATVNLYQILAT